MPFYVYILKRIKTNTLKNDSNNTNAGKTRSTKHGIPWKLVYYEAFNNRIEAIEREKHFKTTSGRRFLDELKLDFPIPPLLNN